MLIKYDVNQSNAVPPMLNRETRVFNNMSVLIVSNASLESRSIIECPESRLRTMSCCSLITAVSVECDHVFIRRKTCLRSACFKYLFLPILVDLNSKS